MKHYDIKTTVFGDVMIGGEDWAAFPSLFNSEDSLKKFRAWLFEHPNITFDTSEIKYDSPYNWVQSPRMFDAEDICKRWVTYARGLGENWYINTTDIEFQSFPAIHKVVHTLCYETNNAVLKWTFPIKLVEVVKNDYPEPMQSCIPMPDFVKSYYIKSKLTNRLFNQKKYKTGYEDIKFDN